MEDWNILRKKIKNWPHPLWQYSLGLECSICGVTPNQTYEESLVIVEGQGNTLYCKNCYFSKFVPEEDDIEVEELHADDLPPEVMTDGRGNTTLDNWED
mgnify:CR=1 FL=1|tara:strand:- start:29 stop:325 length:297 start_codon:yes stop_codon:yes gene_type:complete